MKLPLGVTSVLMVDCPHVYVALTPANPMEFLRANMSGVWPRRLPSSKSCVFIRTHCSAEAPPHKNLSVPSEASGRRPMKPLRVLCVQILHTSRTNDSEVEGGRRWLLTTRVEAWLRGRTVLSCFDFLFLRSREEPNRQLCICFLKSTLLVEPHRKKTASVLRNSNRGSLSISVVAFVTSNT